jgi:MFS family permease
VLGYSPFEIGLAFLPCTLIMGTLSVRYTEPLVMRFGAKNVLIPGLTFVVLAMLLFARAPVDGNYWVDLFPIQVLFGIGGGTAFPALMMIAMSDSTPQDAGLASGLINTTAQFGAAIGLAVLATLSASRTDDLRAAGDPLMNALNGGYHLSFLVAAGLVFTTIVVAVAVLKPAKQPAHAHAQSHEPAMSEA